MEPLRAAAKAPRFDRHSSVANPALHGMQLFGILVAAPSAAPSEGHAAFQFGVTPPPASVDTCPELAEDGAVTPVPPIAPGTEVAVVVPVAVKGTDGVAVALAPPDVVPGLRPGTFGKVAVAVPGKPATPSEGEAF